MTDQNSLEYLKQLKIEAELRRCKEMLPHLYTSLYKWQREFIDCHSKMVLCTAANQVGKVQPYSTLIPTPDRGLVPLSEIKIGDKIFSSNGEKTKVLQVFPHKDWQFYKITFDDGSFTYAGLEHLWIAKSARDRFKKEYNITFDKFKIYSTQQIIEQGQYCSNTKPTKRFSIPICEAVEYPQQQYEIDPYKLGVILGNGAISDTGNSITTVDQEIITLFKDDIGSKHQKPNNKAISFYILNYNDRLKNLNLKGHRSYTKFIPNIYKIGSIQQRKELLAGLLDTDGTVSKKGTDATYCTTSEQLKNDFIELVNSLGGVVNRVYKRYAKYNKGTKTGRLSYTIAFKTKFNPFKLERKSKRWKPCNRYKHERIIYSIEKSFISDGCCLSVDSKDHSYICEKDYIVTHNTTWMIIKAIKHATEKELWPILWPEMIAMNKVPTQFWYLYEDKNMIMREFETKWIKEWLPKGKARIEGKYRWTYKMKDKCVEYLHFLETDVKIYFFSYGQGVDALQASTVYEMFVDEELPFDQYDELSARLTIPRGIFNAGFTATKGQDQWRRAMECIGKEDEMFVNAVKRTISVFDCTIKEDNTKGLWDEELIKLRIAQCSTHAEVLKRIYGKFVKAEGLVVPEFDVKRHVVPGHPLNPKTWNIWAAIDPGSGGITGHPAGIVVLAVNDECTKGRIIKCWRSGGENVTNTDILKHYKELTKDLDVVCALYDKANKDIYLVAQQLGIPLVPANKARNEGFDTLNSLFKHDMLKIYYSSDNDETHKLKNELMSYSFNHNKAKATTPDNLIDPLRYLAIQIIWNFDAVIDYNLKTPIEKIDKQTQFLNERDKMIHMQKMGKMHEYEQSAKDQEKSLLKELTDWQDYLDEFQ